MIDKGSGRPVGTASTWEVHTQGLWHRDAFVVLTVGRLTRQRTRQPPIVTLVVLPDPGGKSQDFGIWSMGGAGNVTRWGLLAVAPQLGTHNPKEAEPRGGAVSPVHRERMAVLLIITHHI